MRQSNTNLHRLGRNSHSTLGVGSEERRVVDIGTDCVIPFAHDVVFLEIFDCEGEEILLVIACLSEDFAPMSPLFHGGSPDIVFDKGF